MAVRIPSPGTSVFQAAYACLGCCSLEEKCDAVFRLAEAMDRGRLGFVPTSVVRRVESPGCPPRPRLVLPKYLPRRSLVTEHGRAAFVHAIAHIEFNAINLALDALYRFQDMPRSYYSDWVSVAAEEARHFLMVRERLQQFGYDYGDFDAHNGLWEMAVRTSDSVIARMALVPRVLEARGLDVTPAMIRKLRVHGDTKTADILAVILDEEIGHVAIGSRWYRHACTRQNLQPDRIFPSLVAKYYSGRLQKPFHLEARRRAGFSESELRALEDV